MCFPWWRSMWQQYKTKLVASQLQGVPFSRMVRVLVCCAGGRGSIPDQGGPSVTLAPNVGLATRKVKVEVGVHLYREGWAYIHWDQDCALHGPGCHGKSEMSQSAGILSYEVKVVSSDVEVMSTEVKVVSAQGYVYIAHFIKQLQCDKWFEVKTVVVCQFPSTMGFDCAYLLHLRTQWTLVIVSTCAKVLILS